MHASTRTLQRRRFLLAACGSVCLPAGAQPADPLAFLADYESVTGGRVGLSARHLATGAELAWRADERFAMCSTFKMSLAAQALARVDAGQERLERAVAFGPADLLPYAPAAKARLAAGRMTIAELCEAVVVISDNTCANLLLREHGGPAALTQFWRRIEDTASRLDHDEPELNRTRPGDPRDTTTPAAMQQTLARLATRDVLRPASRERLVGWLVACQTGLRKLRAGLPAQGWRIGDKTGSNGADAAGDIAIAWPPRGGPIVIAAYVQGGTPSVAQQDRLFAEIGRAVAARWGTA